MHLFCPAFNGIAVKGELTEDDKKLLTRLRCKSWSCSFCAVGNRKRWTAFLLDVLPAISEVWSFHTITLPSWIRSNDSYSEEDRTIASLALVRANWDKLMKRIKRQLGNVQYFRCFELHADGVLHVHVLLSHHIPENELKTVNKGKENQYLYWRWLKDTLPECGFGYMTSSENLVDGTKATGYVTKYMTKEDGFYSDMLSKYRVRRFQSSQGIGSQDDWGKSEDFWEMRSFIDESQLEYNVYHDLNLKRDLKRSDFGNQGEYPKVSDYVKSDEERQRRKGLID